MKMNKVTSVEDYKIVSSFQSLRKTLLDDKFADRLEKPLAYWALPNDRRLPLGVPGPHDQGLAGHARSRSCRPRPASGKRRSVRWSSCSRGPPRIIRRRCPSV